VSVEYSGPVWLRPFIQLTTTHYFHRAKHIHLTGKQYTDSLADQLCLLKNLESISLLQTQVTPDSLERLKQTLPDCEFKVATF